MQRAEGRECTQVSTQVGKEHEAVNYRSVKETLDSQGRQGKARLHGKL
jgi:hypothetical protein